MDTEEKVVPETTEKAQEQVVETTEKAPDSSKFEQIAEDQRKRAEKAESEASDLRKALAAATQQANGNDLSIRNARPAFDEIADNMAVLRNLQDDEVTELRSQAKELGVDPVKFAESKTWQGYLETQRSQKEAESSTPEPSNRFGMAQNNKWAETVQKADASKADRQAAFNETVQSVVNRGSRNMI